MGWINGRGSPRQTRKQNLDNKKLSKALLKVIVPNRRNNKALHGTRTENNNFRQLLSFKLSLKNQLTTSL